jgi:dihydroflavonol-4-reductase
MRVVVTGGAGFVGRAVVERLRTRGDDVIALVRDPATAVHLEHERVTLVRSSLADPGGLGDAMRGADAVIHVAGMYRVGIAKADRPAMWDANVGATERVLDAALAAGVPRIVYVSTVNVFGDTHGAVADETYRRDLAAGFTSWYDETKFRAHEAAESRIAGGAPIVVVLPSQVYGPHDHSLTSEQLHRAFHGTLRYLALTSVGLGWVHVHDLADGMLAALDRGRDGELYCLAGPNHTLAASIAIAAELGGKRVPPFTMPTAIARLVAPLNDAVGGLPGMPPNLGETIRSADRVTYYATAGRARRELGFAPRSLEQGIADTWGRH